MPNPGDYSLPERGFVFWPVGTGDSTTIVIDPERVLQVDIRHMAISELDSDPRLPVIDHLEAILPKRGGRPYLSAFVLTHPDLDHCQGFAELLDRVVIGELWFSPRVFWEFKEDLSDDAVTFKEEAERRVRVLRSDRTPAAGERVRVVGYADILRERSEYAHLPDSVIAVPGTDVTEVDGEQLGDRFRAFIHSPFKDDAEDERNDTSIGMQLSLISGDNQCRALLLGDLSNPVVKRIFSASNNENLQWNILLAPHHCSKSVLYVSEGGIDVLDRDLRDQIQQARLDCHFVISSSMPIPDRNTIGDNPPHAVARNRYQEMVDTGRFLCTGEHESTDSPDPIILAIDEDGCPGEAAAAVLSRDAVLAPLVRGSRSSAPARPTRFGG